VFSGEIDQAVVFFLDIHFEKLDGAVVGRRSLFQRIKVLAKVLDLRIELAIFLLCQ
jgi:hypothetical protein